MLKAATVLAVKWMMTSAALAQVTAAGANVTPTWTLGPDTKVVKSVAEAKQSKAGYKELVADVERWKFTPADEQAHPAKAIKAICATAHARHERCIAAPALDLFHGTSGYLKSWVTKAAASADAWEVQAQKLELHPTAYRKFVLAVKAKTHAVQPHVTMLAGLTTSNRVGDVTGPKLWRAFKAVRGDMTGFWGNVPGAGPECPTCGAVNAAPLVYVLNRTQ